jgi:hypothetical protein
MIYDKEIARIKAAQGIASSPLVRQALADALKIASAVNAPQCNHAVQIRELTKEVAQLRTAAATTGGKHPRKPCPGCGALMRVDSSNRGNCCRDCYNAKCEARRQALADAVAKVNADPERPATVAGCLHIVANIASIAPGSVRNLMARWQLVVSPKRGFV